MRRGLLLAVLLVVGIGGSGCTLSLPVFDPSQISIPPQIRLVGLSASVKVGDQGTFVAEVYETKPGASTATTTRVSATCSFTPPDILDVTQASDHWEFTAMKPGVVTIAYSYGGLSGITPLIVTQQ